MEMSSDKKPLLVPLDGSLPAGQPLEVAQAIAELKEDEIHVLFVSSRPLSPEELADKVGLPEEWRPRITLLNAVGEPAEAICRVASEIDADAILMSTHGRTGDLQSVAGHVTLDVLRDPPCPVYVVRSALNAASQAQRLRCLRRILVPLDGTFEAVWSVGEASALAKRANARLIMLHVVDDRPETARAPASPVFMDHPSYELEAWRDEFIRSSFAVHQPPPVATTDVVLRAGDPGREISRYAADSDADLVVASWNGSMSKGRARVVQKLLQRATYPLLFLVGTRSNLSFTATSDSDEGWEAVGDDVEPDDSCDRRTAAGGY
ncbi:MAG: universal stress protein [Dehalococcoidia bacterium]